MSERGQGGGQGQPPSQAGGQGKPGQNYVVKAEFTDENGKKWTVGSKFEGDEAAVKKAVAAGKIEERPQATPT